MPFNLPAGVYVEANQKDDQDDMYKDIKNLVRVYEAKFYDNKRKFLK